MINQGVFGMRTVEDLLQKANHDLERLRSDPTDTYAAFDFFVSARHLPDWLHPGDPKARKALFDLHVELRICRHIVDTGKHFMVTQKMHQQIKATEKTNNAWGTSWGKSWGNSWGEDTLVVHLDDSDPDTAVLGSEITALDLAERTILVLQRIVPQSR